MPAPYKQTTYNYDRNKKSETTNFVLRQNQYDVESYSMQNLCTF